VEAALRKEKNANDPGARAVENRLAAEEDASKVESRIQRIEVLEPERTKQAAVAPTVNTLRTRGAVVLVFDVNATITDVVNTAMNAWHAARG
jgi:predicted N-formylglutamate amidohydrolase